MNSCCKTPIRIIHSFLNATEGNWRNAVYIECRYCKYERTSLCTKQPDMLCVAAADGSPLLLPVSDAEILFARCLDKSECLVEISNLRFQDLFRLYISQYCEDKTSCPLLRIYEKQMKTTIFPDTEIEMRRGAE